MYYNDHAPPHVHAEYQGRKVLVDFRGNVLRGELGSRTAVRLLREWVDLHEQELQADWELARMGQDLRSIVPLQ